MPPVQREQWEIFNPQRALKKARKEAKSKKDTLFHRIVAGATVGGVAALALMSGMGDGTRIATVTNTTAPTALVYNGSQPLTLAHTGGQVPQHANITVAPDASSRFRAEGQAQNPRWETQSGNTHTPSREAEQAARAGPSSVGTLHAELYNNAVVAQHVTGPAPAATGSNHANASSASGTGVDVYRQADVGGAPKHPPSNLRFTPNGIQDLPRIAEWHRNAVVAQRVAGPAAAAADSNHANASSTSGTGVAPPNKMPDNSGRQATKSIAPATTKAANPVETVTAARLSAVSDTGASHLAQTNPTAGPTQPSSGYLNELGTKADINTALAAARTFSQGGNPTQPGKHEPDREHILSNVDVGIRTLDILKQILADGYKGPVELAIWFIQNQDQGNHGRVKTSIFSHAVKNRSVNDLAKTIDYVDAKEDANQVPNQTEHEERHDAYAGLALAASRGDKIANAKLVKYARDYDEKGKQPGQNWPGLFAAEAGVRIGSPADQISLWEDPWTWLTGAGPLEADTVDLIALSAANGADGALEWALTVVASDFDKAVKRVKGRLNPEQKAALIEVEGIVRMYEQIQSIGVGSWNANDLYNAGQERLGKRAPTQELHAKGCAYLALAKINGNDGALDRLDTIKKGDIYPANAQAAIKAIQHVPEATTGVRILRAGVTAGGWAIKGAGEVAWRGVKGAGGVAVWGSWELAAVAGSGVSYVTRQGFDGAAYLGAPLYNYAVEWSNLAGKPEHN